LLGSNYKAVQEKAIELIKSCGPVTGLFHEYELKLAELINKYMPSVEMFRMLATGTEADMAAIRVARTFTGKRKIIKWVVLTTVGVTSWSMGCTFQGLGRLKLMVFHRVVILILRKFSPMILMGFAN